MKEYRLYGLLSLLLQIYIKNRFPLLRIFAMLKHPLCVARVWQGVARVWPVCGDPVPRVWRGCGDDVASAWRGCGVGLAGTCSLTLGLEP